MPMADGTKLRRVLAVCGDDVRAWRSPQSFGVATTPSRVHDSHRALPKPVDALWRTHS